MSPNRGSVAGGTEVTISGRGVYVRERGREDERESGSGSVREEG